MDAVERPSEEEVDRLEAKFGPISRYHAEWDQQDVDFRREMEDPPSFGEVIPLVLDEAGRLAIVRKRGHDPVAFDIPTGIIEEGEGVEEVAKREALEETGCEVRVADLLAIYQVRVRWQVEHHERWFFALRCPALAVGEGPLDTQEIEEVKFVRLPEEMPEWWPRSEWWGGRWREQVLKDGGLL